MESGDEYDLKLYLSLYDNEGQLALWEIRLVWVPPDLVP
jgi:hypothetical protein